MSQNIPLGIYAWNPNGNDPAAEAAFQSKVASFTQGIRAPEYIDAFFDMSSWAAMVPSAQWVAWSQSRSPVAHSMTPVVGVPLGTWQDHGTDTLWRIANGQMDDVYRGIAEAYRSAGYTSVDMRVGWEMNGDYMPWSMGSTHEQVAAWRAAFAHLADVFHAIPGMDVDVVWNPGLSNNAQISVTESYPGDDKVDIMAIDIYSSLYKYDPAVTDTQFYNYPSASTSHPTGIDSVQWGLVQAAAFAAAHGKPLGIGETGVKVGDSLALPQAIADVYNAPGAPKAAFVNIWDVTTYEGDWEFTGGHADATARAWSSALGAGTQSAPTQAAAPVPAPTPTPAPAPVTQQAAPVVSAVVAEAASVLAPINAITVPDAGPLQFLSYGANRAQAYWGPMHIAGDAGSDNYVIHPGDKVLVVENFSAAKGDWLEISSSLRSSFRQEQFDGGVKLSFAGDANNTQSAYLKGPSGIDQSIIWWS